MDKKVTTSIETITPDIAKNLLNGNNFRKANTFNIDGCVQLMKEGELQYGVSVVHKKWPLSGEPIVFDKGGNLLHGQRRLLACVKARASLETAVVRNTSSKTVVVCSMGTFKGIDEGKGKRRERIT